MLNPAASAFYDEAGSAAAALGLSVDILVVSARSCGLNAIQALASGSGGVLRLYGSLQHAAMPQVRPQKKLCPCRVGSMCAPLSDDFSACFV